MEKKKISEKTKTNEKPKTKAKIKIKKKIVKKKPEENINEKPKKKNYTTAIICLLLTIAIVLATYSVLGIELTAVVGALLAVLWFFGFLLSRIKSRKRRRKVISILIILFLLLGIAVLVAFSYFLYYIKTQADPKFTVTKLNTVEVSRIYANDNTEIAKLGEENREKVTYEQLPEVLVDAIVATEDSRFFQHNGFDAPRFIKATLGQLAGNSGAGGASTLSMQVVKNSFTSTEASGIAGIIRKFEDIYLAVFKLEKSYTKEQIIEYYVNNHFLGGNIYGVEEASRAYFGKSVTELNLSEAAILAGMFKSPNAYKPTTNPQNAANRRTTVLYLMRKHGYITKEEEAIANAIPVESLTDTSASLNVNPYQGYIDTVVKEVKDKYGVNPYTTPLLVYTNLDINRQNAVNAVLRGENYNWKDDKVQTGVAVLESATGKILAIGNGRNVNGRDGDAREFNYAVQLDRQPGSTAKPLFDYGPGIEYNNWSTYEQFDDAPYSYTNGKSIKNWDNGYYGVISLRTALSTSRNIPALKAFQLVDNKKIVEFVTNLGIRAEVYGGKVHEAHSIGAFTGVSPLEMSAAYAAFSNGGYYNEPYSVSKIVYRQTGEEKVHEGEKKQVMSDATAFMISSVLQNVALTDGTPYNMAVKTGTTNYDEQTMNSKNLPWDAIRDSWVVGYSTKTTMAVWYGYDYIDSYYCLHNIPATMAKDRLYRALVNAGAVEANREAFTPPKSVSLVAVSPGSNPAKLALPGQEAVYEYFKKGHEPSEYDTSKVKLAAPGNLKLTDKNNKITLSWEKVDPGILADPDQGTFGYYIYKDDILVDWTSKLTYTFTPNGSKYGTYKVVASYKKLDGVKSEEAIKVYKEEKEDEEDDKPQTSPEPSTSPKPTTSPQPSTEPNNPEESE